jgi:hypothetical protein
MKKLVCAIAALACLTAAPALITPADAQVSIGIGEDGPGIGVGRDEDRGMRRGEDRGRYNGSRNQGECREVTEATVQTPRNDGSVTTHETRRCD